MAAGQCAAATHFRRMSMIRILTLLALLWAGAVHAADTPVRVAPGQLAEVVAAAEPGAWLHLDSGVHPGGVRIEVPLKLTGEDDAVLDGDGSGHVLVVAAPDVSVEGLTLRNGGAELGDLDAAIFVESRAAGVRLVGNRIHARGFGIWLDGSSNALVADNRISGDTALRSQDRGNGIHLFNVNEATVSGNTVWETRDGIYIDVSNNNRLLGNTLHDQRYGVHYMFSHDNEVIGNRTRDNRTGFALMASRNLKVVDNRAEGDESYGFLLNDISYSTIADNTAIAIRHGTTPGTGRNIKGAEGKAMFIYNSQHNTVRDNLLAGTDIGIHLTAGSEGNRIYRNALVNNRSQVMYVATRDQEWSVDGEGNYWSDYIGWDLNGDGIGDVAHEPNDSVDRLLWTYPMARVLMNSPAVQLLRWVQREFPILRPFGVKDSAPLMRPTRSLEELG